MEKALEIVTDHNMEIQPTVQLLKTAFTWVRYMMPDKRFQDGILRALMLPNGRMLQSAKVPGVNCKNHSSLPFRSLM